METYPGQVRARGAIRSLYGRKIDGFYGFDRSVALCGADTRRADGGSGLRRGRARVHVRARAARKFADFGWADASEGGGKDGRESAGVCVWVGVCGGGG